MCVCLCAKARLKGRVRAVRKNDEIAQYEFNSDINIITKRTHLLFYYNTLLHVDGNRRGEFLPVTDMLPVGKL